MYKFCQMCRSDPYVFQQVNKQPPLRPSRLSGLKKRGISQRIQERPQGPIS
jgi:hypothetical protein